MRCKYTNVEPTTTLSLYQTVTEIVQTYLKAVVDIKAGFALISGAEKSLNNTFAMEHWGTIQVRSPYNHSSPDYSDVASSIKVLERDVWGALIERMDIRRMVGIQRWREISDQLEKGELPEITEVNVINFAQNLLKQLPDMLTEAVGEVFDFLRPQRSSYKTNSELEIGRKVILTNMVELWSLNTYRVNGHRSQHLTALENVFSALAGQGQINKRYRSALETEVAETRTAQGETPYFRFKLYRNGNMHLEFKRLDLLKRLNQIAGGRRLRPATA